MNFVKVLIMLILLHRVTQAAELVIWTSNEGAAKALNEIKPSFEKEYQTKVLVETLNKDLTTLFKTAALTGKGPDVFLWANDVSGELAESGLIEPIDETRLLKQNFLEPSLSAFRYHGRLYGYPIAVESIAMFYNRKLINQAPLNFEDLVTYSKALQARPGIYGFLYDYKNFFFSYPILNANGGYIFKETPHGLDINDLGLNDPGFRQGLSFLRSLVDQKIIPSSTDRAIAFEKFKKNELATTIDGPWAIKDLVESKVDFGVCVLPLLNQNRPKPFVGSHGLMIRRGSSNKLLAKEFIEKYVMTFSGIKSFHEKDTRIPARKDVLDFFANKDPYLKVFKQSVESGISMPNIPQMGSVWAGMGKAMSLVLDQNYPIEKALNLSVSQIKSEIQKGNLK